MLLSLMGGRYAFGALFRRDDAPTQWMGSCRAKFNCTAGLLLGMHACTTFPASALHPALRVGHWAD